MEKGSREFRASSTRSVLCGLRRSRGSRHSSDRGRSQRRFGNRQGHTLSGRRRERCLRRRGTSIGTNGGLHKRKPDWTRSPRLVGIRPCGKDRLPSCQTNPCADTWRRRHSRCRSRILRGCVPRPSGRCLVRSAAFGHPAVRGIASEAEACDWWATPSTESRDRRWKEGQVRIRKRCQPGGSWWCLWLVPTNPLLSTVAWRLRRRWGPSPFRCNWQGRSTRRQQEANRRRPVDVSPPMVGCALSA